MRLHVRTKNNYSYYSIIKDYTNLNGKRSTKIFEKLGNQNQVEERLDEIYSLKRKYGNTIEEICSYKIELEEEIHKIENIDEENERTKEKIAKIKEKMDILCDKINAKRIEQSKVLNEKINNELKELEMKNARFNAKVIKDETFSYNGNSHVEFVISTNLGEEEKKLNKIASGGEMSRFMLAFKTILADMDEIDTLVFDEIDTGISGIAAQIVGQKLSNIGKKKQVICITHLPQIAANGDTHYRIEKNTANNRTYTNIKELTLDERIDEIARLIAGNNITEKTIEHAHEIIELAQS